MFFQTGEISLYYEKKGGGLPIILVHGNGESHRIFDELSEALSEDFTVYAVDLRGHGGSTPVAHYDYREMASDIAAFITKLGIDRPAFYGFSDGGIIGLLLASQMPCLFSRLIVSGANTKPKGLKSRYLFYYRFANLLKRDPKIEMMLTQPDISVDDLKKIAIPTLVLAGSRDVIRKSDTQSIADSIPDSTLKVLDGETHSSYVVHSCKLLPLIREFCNISAL